MPTSQLTYLIVIRWSASERAYIAKAPGLSGCIGTGDTYQSALASCLEAMQWRAAHAEQRREPLSPAEYSWSGANSDGGNRTQKRRQVAPDL